MRPGVVVANRFRIEAIAGAGGMGTVYRAVDLAAGGYVALKTLAGLGEREAARFAREAAVLGELVHPGIVRFIAHGLTAEHEHYLAMEWLEGETLHDRLQRGRFSVADAITLGRAIADALGAAHARGVVHRDIKPMNLFLPGGELAQVKLLDFGIARHIHHAGMLTNSGVVIGTPGYMAPEQVRGETQIDARTDVFSLGCVLYRCLTGSAAFPGEQSLAVLARILVDDVAAPSTIAPTVPAAIDALVLRMLDKHPAARPADGRAVADALAAFVDVTLRDAPAKPTAGREPSAETVSTQRSAPAHERAAITASEQRLVSIVLMVPGRDVTEPDPDRIGVTATAFGGRLERIGDGSSIVLFAHADVATDHAARAARCALALRDIVGHATLVVASGRAAIDHQLVGDLIDRAAAAVADAAPGQIIIDGSTATLLDDRFVVTRSGERQYLRGIRDGAEPVRTLLGKTTPIVGRDRELGNLQALWAECVDERIARIVLVTAAPGAGKSRVRQELVRRVLQRDERAELLIGRGDSLRAGSPFSLLADALRRSAGVREGDDLEVQRTALRARVGRHVTASEVDRVTHLLGEIAGVAFPTAASEALRAARADPLAKGDAMRTAWVDFLEAECADHPVLLVLEDLHWGDRPTIDLVDAALRELAQAPLMVVALARPEIHDTFPKLWAERALQEIRLPQLTRKASDRLVQVLLGDAVAPELLTRIVERADGNAFFLEELIRAVAEGRGESLPDSVLSMLQLRLDALGAEVKRVLRAGSVFGEVFWRGGIAELLGDESRDDSREQLATLVQRELIAVAPRTRISGEVEYTFRHDLVREAAYAMMSASDRVVAHQRAASWLVANGFTDALVLAEHLSRGEQPTRAAECYATAADQALAGNDHVSVFALVERGLACQPSAAIEARLHVVVAEACNWQGDHARAVVEAERARAMLPRGTVAWFQATDEAFYGAGRSGDIARAIAMVGDLTATVAESEAVLQQLRSIARAAIVMIRFGPPGVGAALTARVEELAARAAVDLDTEQRLHTLRAMAARARGEAGRCFEEHAAGIRACEITHNQRELAFTHLSASNCYSEIGEPALAREHVERGVQISERVGATTVTPLLYFARGMAMLEAGDLAEAQRSAMRAVELASGRDRAAEGLARWVAARVALGLGDHATCHRELGLALALLDPLKLYNPLVLAITARLELACGNPSAARAAAGQAMATLRVVQGFEEGESLVRLVEIEALEALGDYAAARAATATALARLDERAARIDEPWRSKFLAKPDNAATIARRGQAT